MKYCAYCFIILLVLFGSPSSILYAQTISTIAGNGVPGLSGNGGQATAAELNTPYGLYADPAGNIYVGDVSEERVRKISSSGIISAFAGGGTTLGDGGQATAAAIYNPSGITGDAAGNIYIADAASNKVRKVNAAGIITTFAGATILTTGDGYPATSAHLLKPTGVAIDAGGNIYIADYEDHKIRKVNPAGIITTYAGNGSPGYTGDGGQATAARIYAPWGIAIDGGGNLYISDVYNNSVRKVTPAGIITTCAGNSAGLPGFSGDGGQATAARLSEPYGIATDNFGNLYITDQGNERIRKITPSGIISTYAGNGVAGYGGDGGLAIYAKLNLPYGLAVNAGGNLFIADGNARVRYVTDTLHIGAITGSSTVCAGASVLLSDTTAGGTWSSSNTGVAIVDAGLGIVSGIATGTALISYTKSGISVIDTITVVTFRSVGTITGPVNVCPEDSIALIDTASGGIWNSSNSVAAVNSSGTVTAGFSAGTDTIIYTITNACGPVTAMHIIHVLSAAACALNQVSGTRTVTDLKIFPNPTNGAFTLLFSSPADERITITITSISGEKVNEIITRSNMPCEVTLSRSQPIYFVTVTTKTGQYNQKVSIIK